MTTEGPVEPRGSIACRVCEQRELDRRATARYLVVHHPDGSTWIHYECESAHAIHQALAGHPPRVLECNCDAPD